MLEFTFKNVIFVIVAMLLGVLIAIGLILLASDSGGAEQPELYSGVPLDAHLLELDKRALEQAYGAHLAKLWNVWLSDGAREAHRISNGLKIARAAYAQAAREIKKREELEKQK